MVRVLALSLILSTVAACGSVDSSTATVTITLTGTGTGEFEVSHGTVECSGTTCTAKIPIGIPTVITPAPADGSTFDGWSGSACDALATACEINATSDMSLTAGFVAKKVLVRVAKNGGVSRITSTPPGIDCGGDCAGVFDSGAMVTLTQTPTPGSTFMGWSGGCSGTGDCTVTAAEGATVTANYTCEHGMQTFNFTGALQTFTLPACVPSITIDAFGAQGGGTAGGGKGAEIKGTFPGGGSSERTYYVLVGGMGASASGNGSGGGGSYVFLSETAQAPLLVAGGGGGISSNSSGCVAGPGSATIAPTSSTGGSGNGAGGSNGSGGAGGNVGDSSNPGAGGGGAGWFGAGGAGATANPGGGGQPVRSGGAGGAAGTNGANGGYGGGGGSAGITGACGGGGGYSGGGGGNSWVQTLLAWGCGGGGGSFNNGTDQMNMAGVRAGNGQVIVTW